MERMTYSLTAEIIKWIRKQSETTGLNQSEIVRRAIDLYRKRLPNIKQKKKKKGKLK